MIGARLFTPLWEGFDCPRCARAIARPAGSETWHPCGEHIPAPAPIALILAHGLNVENELLRDMIMKEESS